MPIFNTTISGGGTTPTGSISITNNGTYDVTDKATAVVNVPTTAPALYREFQLSSTSTLVPNTTTAHIMDFTGMRAVSDFALARAYYNNTAISGTVDMGDLTTINGIYACAYMFYQCTELTGANLSALTEAGGSNACNSMFQGCTGLINANLPALTTIGSNACQSMFSGCTALTGVNLPVLSTINGSNACLDMFANCRLLISVDLPALTTISGSLAFSRMFVGCTSLATVYIGGTTAIDFGTRANQFSNMFQNCTQNIDAYAPAANQAKIEAMLGYPNFGGTGTVTWHWRS